LTLRQALKVVGFWVTVFLRSVPRYELADREERGVAMKVVEKVKVIKVGMMEQIKREKSRMCFFFLPFETALRCFSSNTFPRRRVTCEYKCFEMNRDRYFFFYGMEA
jgi:hypothetical protein